MTSTVIEEAMVRALDLARRGPAHGPNPQVGCVILADDGAVVGEGWHRGAGTPHAEAAALAAAAAAGLSPRGATAVVTLEPCSHHGRTPPCAEALAEAGVARVVFAVVDPHPDGSGGAAYLNAHGVSVEAGVGAAEGEDLLHVWLTAVRRGRPYVTLKLAQSLDARVAARDGSNRWITGTTAREHAHRVRAEVDAIVVGTGTALTDDPSLTARTSDGTLARHQPVRVVVGQRDLPGDARLHAAGGELFRLRTHDVGAVLDELGRRELRHVLVEGGPTVATAFLRADVVDEIHTYLAPLVLGAGLGSVGDLGIDTLGGGMRFCTTGVERLGDDVLVTMTRADRSRPTGPGTHQLEGKQT